MSYFSSSSDNGESPSEISTIVSDENDVTSDTERDAGSVIRRMRERVAGGGIVGNAASSNNEHELELSRSINDRDAKMAHSPVIMKKRGVNRGTGRERSFKMVGLEEMDEEEMALIGNASPERAKPTVETVVILGREITRRRWGMILAAVFGLWGGSVMAPMKLCKSNIQGSRFVISFGIGASVVNLFFWLVRYCYNVYKFKSLSKAYARLPSFHLDVMWRPGGLSGLLWSIGNFFSLISVKYLGQGVGYPLVQSQIMYVLFLHMLGRLICKHTRLIQFTLFLTEYLVCGEYVCTRKLLRIEFVDG